VFKQTIYITAALNSFTQVD